MVIVSDVILLHPPEEKVSTQLYKYVPGLFVGGLYVANVPTDIPGVPAEISNHSYVTVVFGSRLGVWTFRGFIVPPSHIISSCVGVFTVGAGFTVMVCVFV